MNFIKKIGVLLLIACIAFVSCKKDDDGHTVIPPRDLTEVSLENDAEIKDYLQTHFYNYEDFESPSADFNYQIVLDTIAGENSDKTPLIDQVQSRIMKIRDIDDTEVSHTIYYLSAREGAGEAGTVADSIYLTYRGSLLDNTTFDVRSNPIWMDVLGTPTIPGVVRGFREAISNFKPSASDVIINEDGTVSFENDYGVGIFFLPSGLAYFNNTQGSIPVYSPIVFRVNLLVSKRADHDRDGVLSIDEIEYNSDTGIITFPDSNGNGNPDYIDPTYPNP